MTHTPDALSRCLWDGVAVQWVVQSSSNMPLCLLQCYDCDLRSSIGYMCVLPVQGASASGLQSGLRVALQEVFRALPLRKVWIPALENVSGFTKEAFGDCARLEGTLQEYELVSGSSMDLNYFSLNSSALGII